MTNWSGFAGGTGARVTGWNYNSYRGWLDSKTYPGGVSGPAYTYTAAGRLQTRQWARGITTTYTYNNAGGLAGISYSDGSTPGLGYSYDRLGRQATITQGGSAVTTLAYNTVNGVLSESCSGGVLAGLSVTNGYDQYLRRTDLAARNSGNPFLRHSFGYDNASRLQTVTDNTTATPYSATYAYLANSPLVSQITFKSNTVTRMTTSKQWDYLNRLTWISSAVGSSAVGNAYACNNANQRIRSTLPDGSYWLYDFDSLGQVRSGRRYWPDQSPVAGQQFEYAFDDIGNRVQTKAGGDANGWNLRTANYGANSLNQYTNRDVPAAIDVMGLAFATNGVTVNGQTAYRKGEYFRAEVPVSNTSTSVWQSVTVHAAGQTDVTGNVYLPKNPERFSYDGDGNLTNDGRWTYIWDGENRLVKLTPSTSIGPRNSIKFEYDWQGRRIHKQVWNNTGWSGYATNDVKFVYDGWNLLAELNGTNNAVIRSFMWGLDLSGSLQGAGGVGGLLEVIYKGPQTTNCFVAFDGNGNVIGLADAGGSGIFAQYDYGAFGEVIRATGPMGKANPFRFSSKYQDDETELLYYGYRYYTPSAARWLNRDSIAEAGGLNPYAFAENQSVTKIDVLGKWHATVHNGLTWGYAFMVRAFTWTYADAIAFADEGVDSWWRWESSLPLIGDQERHMLYVNFRGYLDSRDYWYDTEFNNATSELRTAERTHSVGCCRRAAEAFGRGLHSRQDRSAHRAWPGGGNWHPTRMHPAWWDAYDDSELGAWGLSEDFWNDRGNRNLQTAGWGEDYIPWYGTPGQRQSQERARERVRRDTDEATSAFEIEVRRTCFCRSYMLRTLPNP